jgi:hypothetical protein
VKNTLFKEIIGKKRLLAGFFERGRGGVTRRGLSKIGAPTPKSMYD